VKGTVVLSIVLESQRDKAPRKKFSWPVYITVARAERESPSVGLVIAIDAQIAAWAAEKIDLGWASASSSRSCWGRPPCPS
jgi:hypothetical protein